MCNQLINNKIDLRERERGAGGGQGGEEESYLLTLCQCVFALYECVCRPACTVALAAKTLILY